jgi:hypothetical protein
MTAVKHDTARLVCVVAATAVSLATWIPVGVMAQQRVVFRFDVTRESSLHEPIVLEYTIDNPTQLPVHANLGLERLGQVFDFDLTHPDGSTRSLRPTLERLGFERILPQSVRRGRLILDQWFDFSQVGDYRLQVRFSGTIDPGASTPPDVQRISAFTISIGPRNEEALRRKCELLLPYVLRISPPGDWPNASKELAYLRDPVAVPYLQQGIAARSGDYDVMLDALVEIRTDAAIEAIVALTKHPTDWIARAATEALKKVRSGVSIGAKP